MPDSIFGSPHLLASGSAPIVSGNRVGTPTPVYQPPPSFADVHFGTIGKPPSLLSRISEPDPTKVIFRSLSPVNLSPSPVAPHDHVPNSRGLLERIQKNMNSSQQNPSIQSPGEVHEPRSRPRMNRLRFVTSNPSVPSSNSITPPILSTISESNLPPSDTQHSPAQQVQTLDNSLPSTNIVRETSMPDLVYPATTPTIEQSDRDASSFDPVGPSIADPPSVLPPQPMQSPVSLVTIAPPSPNLPFAAGLSSSQVPDAATTAEAPQEQVAQDPLSAIHAQLRARNDAFASHALPPLIPRSPSPLAAPSNISELAASLRSEINTEDPNAIVLRHPYPQNNSTSNGHSYRELLSSDSTALALARSQTPSLPASRNTHLSSLVGAMKKLQAAAGIAVKQQLDADRAFESERTEFEERRKTFEDHMLANEAEHQSQMQALQKQLEELRAREQRLVALEEDSRLREEARRARDAQRRARDDQQKLEDESRRKAIHDEMVDVVQLLEEAKAEKQRWHEERERSERDRVVVQVNALPLQFPADVGPPVAEEVGMTKEELMAVDKYNRYLARVGYLSAQLRPLIACTRQLSDTLQRMRETRLQAAEAERRRIADEAESQRVQAEAENQRTQVEAEKQKVQAEAERQRDQAKEAARLNEGQYQILDEQGPQQSISVGGERLSHEDHTQPQAHSDLQKSQGPPDAQAEYARLRAQVFANKQQITITAENAARIRAERAGLVALSATRGDNPDNTDMEVEIDELESSPVEHTAPLRQKGASKAKKTPHSQGTSGKVMLGTPSTTPSRPSDTRALSTPTIVTLSDAPASYKTPSFVSASTEVGRQVITDAPLYPTEFASEFNLPTSPPSNDPVPTSKSIPFPTTPKSQTVFASQIKECPVGPIVDHSPAHKDANLRHIKKNRNRLQNNSGDRHVKRHDDGLPIKTIKTEEVDMSHDSEQTSSATPELGSSTQPMDAPVQNDDPPTQAILNPINSQQSNVPPTRLISQPNVTSSVDTRVGSVGDPSRPMPRLSTTPISPDPWSMDTSVERRGWTVIPVSPRSEHGSRQNSQISARTPSPESFTYRQRDSYYPDHYSPLPVPPTFSLPRLIQRNEPGASRLPARPWLKVTNSRKRPAESDNEDDNRDRRRPRGDHYEPERERDSRNIHGLAWRHYSPPTGGRSISPDGKPYSYQPERRRKYSPTIPDRRGIRNEGSYRPDHTDTAGSFAGYEIEDHATPDEPRDGAIALLKRMSSAPVGALVDLELRELTIL